MKATTNDLREMRRTIEGLAMEVAGLRPTDLPRLGRLLKQMDSIHAQANGVGPPTTASLTGGLKLLIERLIMEEVPDPNPALAAIGEGISLLRALQESQDRWTERADFWSASVTSLGILSQGVGERNRTALRPSSSEASPKWLCDRELFEDFIREALEHLESIEIHLINLEQNPKDQECINQIFRPFHNIKGVAGFLNLGQINRFAHEIETLLDDLRSDHLQVSPELIDFVLSAVDQMKTMIIDLKHAMETGTPLTDWDLTPHIEVIHWLQQSLSEGLPPRPQPIGQILVENGAVDPADVEEALAKQRDQAEPKRLGEILIAKGKAKPKQVLHALRHQRTQIPTVDTAKAKLGAFRVEAAKLDAIMTMIGELTDSQSKICENRQVNAMGDPRLFRDLNHLRLVAGRLQRAVLSLPMAPVGRVFGRMARLAQDLAREAGKSVDFRIEGGDTEMDRNVLDTLYDPLVHMIRNAIDHGIEMPARRKRLGKPESGTITLKASETNRGRTMEIRDDGCGLDRERILRRAVEKGLVRAGANLTEKQIDHLILSPGLTTSDRITLLSGRGVGMDVVKKAVESLGGTLTIRSEAGRGCVFRIRLPRA